MESTPSYYSFWAKTENITSEKTHLLIYHLLDVGECVHALWECSLSEMSRRTFANFLNLDFDSAGYMLAFWAALHDLGKAAPGFQRKFAPRIPMVEAHGFVFPKDISVTPAPHGILSAWALKDLLVQETALNTHDAKQLAFALGGHHGTWPTNDHIQAPNLQKSDQGDGGWDEARRALFRAVQVVYQPAYAVKLPEDQGERNAFLTLFSGLTSVADWIGSMSEHFPFRDDYLSAAQYIGECSAPQAREALQKLGWIGWRADGQRWSFPELFPKTPQVNPIQAAAFQAAAEQDLPALVILEAPTGIGKTEAALWLANAWLERQQGSGLYIAMPTQATSNQMHERVTHFLEHRYPGQPIHTLLIHGAALLKENDELPRPEGIAQDAQSPEGSVNAEAWFLPRKRTLLAPFGVGTVDQALMSVLQTNHFFVRMFGLGQKVVIFDEVHAYDTYMSTLFQRLLRWLRSIGTSVILLSATLPEKTRRELASAWLGGAELNLADAAYPRLTLASAAQVKILELPRPANRSLNLTWINSSPEQIADHLAEKLAGGGCAAVICNRVKRAQEIYQALQSRGLVESENLILFHARFPFHWRSEIERRVLTMFGKDRAHGDGPNPNRPRKAIVVATQVIEQSLDLDFDYLLTDLAPVDLLLQRAGRLQRHPQNQANRPPALQNACMAIARPEVNGDLPEFGLYKVYEHSVLLRSWLALHERESLRLPEETAGLIEAVYGDNGDEGRWGAVVQNALLRADEKARSRMAANMDEAQQRLVRMPDDENLLTHTHKGLEEEDARVGAAFSALTRLGDPSVALICLHQTGQGLALDPDGAGAPVDVSQRPTLKAARDLLRRAVSVQRKEVVAYFNANPATSAEWRKSAAVRYHIPVMFSPDGLCRPPGAAFCLKLTREYGLEVILEEK